MRSIDPNNFAGKSFQHICTLLNLISHTENGYTTEANHVMKASPMLYALLLKLRKMFS